MGEWSPRALIFFSLGLLFSKTMEHPQAVFSLFEFILLATYSELTTLVFEGHKDEFIGAQSITDGGEAIRRAPSAINAITSFIPTLFCSLHFRGWSKASNVISKTHDEFCIEIDANIKIL